MILMNVLSKKISCIRNIWFLYNNTCNWNTCIFHYFNNFKQSRLRSLFVYICMHTNIKLVNGCSSINTTFLEKARLVSDRLYISPGSKDGMLVYLYVLLSFKALIFESIGRLRFKYSHRIVYSFFFFLQRLV